MMKLPKRRERPRSGIARAPQREWPRHRKFVRLHECICNADSPFSALMPEPCEGPIECCHYRDAANSGTGLKPADWWTFPACSAHHALQHRIGQDAFEAAYSLTLRETCLALARQSPDLEMRKVLREIEGVQS